ncbi:MAG: hypothetical protein RTU30_11905 [Candidatus Thorarchaeota archaeon]
MSHRRSEETYDRTFRQHKLLVGESILYDIFVRNHAVDLEKIERFDGMLLSTLQKASIERPPTSEKSFTEFLLDVAADLFTELVLAFNDLLIGVLHPDQYLRFSFGPTTFVDEHLLEIPDMVERKMKTMTSTGVNPVSLTKAIISLVRTAASADIARRIFR